MRISSHPQPLLLPGPCLHYNIDATAYSVLRSPHRNALIVCAGLLSNKPNPTQPKGKIPLGKHSAAAVLLVDIAVL